MSFNDELKQIIRDLKYRTQELDAKTANEKIDVLEVTAKISEIYGLAARASILSRI